MVHKSYPSYNEIHNEVAEYAYNVKQNGIEFDCIVALARGGALIGTILSHCFNIPVEYVQYSSTNGRGDRSVPLFGLGLRHINHNRILIVDDINDSGYTMKEVVEEYESRGHIVTTYTVYFRNVLEHIHVPNYSIGIIGDEWIVFPWENYHQL